MARNDDTAPVATDATVSTPEATPASDATDQAATVTEETPASDTATDTATEAAPAGPTDEEKAAQEAAEAANQATFDSALSAAIESRDQASGAITADQVEAIRTAYRSLTTSQKRATRDGIAESMQNALVKDLDAPKARAYFDLGEALKSTKSDSGVAKPPVDVTREFVDRRLALYFAGDFVTAPTGLEDGWAATLTADAQAYKAATTNADGTAGPSLLDQAKSYQAAKIAWDAEATHAEGDTGPTMPEGMPVALIEALRIASGGTARKSAPRKSNGTKSTGTPRTSSYSGSKRNVGQHIAEWAASVAVGTAAKFGEVAKFDSAEYGDDHPSQGAVAAYMDRGNFEKVVGVSIENVDLDGKRGIRRTA